MCGVGGWKQKLYTFCDIPAQMAIDKPIEEEYISKLIGIDWREQCMEEVAEKEGHDEECTMPCGTQLKTPAPGTRTCNVCAPPLT
jgi:hypothetical protein